MVPLSPCDVTLCHVELFTFSQQCSQHCLFIYLFIFVFVFRQLNFVKETAKENNQKMASKNQPSTKPIKKIAKIKLKLKSAEDLAFLPDGSLVVADKFGRRVKVFDRGGEYVKTLAEGVKPLGISTNRSGLVAFSNVNKGKSEVQIITQEGDIVNHWGDDLVWKPRSTEITKRGHLVVTDFHAHARQPIGIYTMDGQSVLKFGQSRDDEFKPWYLTVDPFDRVLLADNDTAIIKIYDSNNGKIVASIKGKDSSLRRRLDPRGLVTDAQGNILVCDYGSDKLAVYSPDGRFINYMLESYDGLVNPYSIAFSHTGYLAVGCNKSNGSLKKIRLYQVLQSAMHTAANGKNDE